MNVRFHETAATCALTVCVVCHIWALVLLAQEYAQGGAAGVRGNISAPLVALYMLSVCLFNWYAVTSGSERYRRVALAVTILHLAGALLQGAAAEALLTAGTRGTGWIMTYGVTLPAILNLPMNSTAVIHRLSSLVPWGTTAFFALNLAVAALRMRRMAGAA